MGTHRLTRGFVVEIGLELQPAHVRKLVARLRLWRGADVVRGLAYSTYRA